MNTIAIVRIDTPNYGWILTLHKTQESAAKAYDKLTEAVVRRYPDATPHLMYRIVELNLTPKAVPGDRIRI